MPKQTEVEKLVEEMEFDLLNHMHLEPKQAMKRLLHVVLKAIERGYVVEHFSICSRHQDYEKSCDICNVGRPKLKPDFKEFLEMKQ